MTFANATAGTTCLPKSLWKTSKPRRRIALAGATATAREDILHWHCMDSGSVDHDLLFFASGASFGISSFQYTRNLSPLDCNTAALLQSFFVIHTACVSKYRKESRDLSKQFRPVKPACPAQPAQPMHLPLVNLTPIISKPPPQLGLSKFSFFFSC